LKRVAIIFMTALICSCASLTPEMNPTSSMKPTLDNWVGRPFDELVSAKGAPLETYILEAGGKVYEYPQKVFFKIDAARLKNPNQKVKVPCEIQFIVSSGNIIERWTTEGDCN